MAFAKIAKKTDIGAKTEKDWKKNCQARVEDLLLKDMQNPNQRMTAMVKVAEHGANDIISL